MRTWMQLRDVGNLPGSLPNLDWPYLDRWIDDLHLRAVLEAVPR